MTNVNANDYRNKGYEVHQFVGNFIYELPFGPGRRFASDTAGVAARLLAGWRYHQLARWYPPHHLLRARHRQSQWPLWTEHG